MYVLCISKITASISGTWRFNCYTNQDNLVPMSFVALILPSFVQHDAASGKHTSTTRHAAATEPKYVRHLLTYYRAMSQRMTSSTEDSLATQTPGCSCNTCDRADHTSSLSLRARVAIGALSRSTDSRRFAVCLLLGYLYIMIRPLLSIV